MSLDVLKQRVPHTICARCRKKFRAGDRMTPAYIIKNPDARNPQTRELAAEIGDEFEMVHASCADPALEGGLVITS